MPRSLRAFLGALAATALLVPALAVGSAPDVASASVPNPPGLPSTVTQDALPTAQINGVAWAQIVIGTTVYVGGSFTSARPAGAALGTSETPRSNLLAYDLTTGTLNASFAPTLNGQVKALAASPDGSRLYVGGDFTTVNGTSKNRIAAVDPKTGAVVSGFAASASSTVSAIVATTSSVYFGGSFTSSAGATRTRLAQVTTAGVLTSWAPTATPYSVASMVLSPDGSKVIVSGSFGALNGLVANGLGAVDATSGATLPFAASTVTKNGGATSSGIDALTSDGTNVYAAGWAYGSGNFEGTMSISPSTGAVNWVNDCWGDTYSVAALGGVLYSASHAHDCSWAGYFPDDGTTKHRGEAWSTTASTHRNSVDGRGWDYSAYPASNLMTWNPAFNTGTYTGQGQGPWNVTTTKDYVLMGGEFTKINGTAQQGLVRFTTHAGAKNAYGPAAMTDVSAFQSTQNGATTVTISAQGASEQDDNYLTYSLIRDGNTASPLATTTAPTAGFWEPVRQPVVFTDTTAAIGSTHTYQIRATDGYKSSTSNTVSVNVLNASSTNLAKGKPATESSSVTPASYAVDGNTDGNYYNNSVAAAFDTNPWWQVDLQSAASLQQIRIWNRTDCCSSALRDFWVFASNTPLDPTLTPAQQSSVAGVWSSHVTATPGPSYTQGLPANTTARYVMIRPTVQNGQFTLLQLAEVEAYGTAGAGPLDLLAGKPATQSSVAFGGFPARAADGSTDGVFNDLSVSHTDADQNAWWQGDLQATTPIGSVVVWNRTDCCSERLTDYWVFVSASPFNTALTPAQQATQAGVWSSHQTVAPAPSTNLTLPAGAQGRYVMVQEGASYQYLSLAEVQAFGP